MGNNLHSPNRNVSPCYRCQRAEKRPGCHDSCGDYGAWAAQTAAIREARQKYVNRPRRKIF